MLPLLVCNIPRELNALAEHIHVPSLPELTLEFLVDQLGPTVHLPIIDSKISVFNSAVATFYAPSDPSGVRGMRRERIRSTSAWRKRGPRRDCAFVVENEDLPGMRGLRVVRVRLFFSFMHRGVQYPCALVEWFRSVGDEPDATTGMWRVEPEFVGQDKDMSVLHLDTFLRGAHLIPIFGPDPLPLDFRYSYSLDAFKAFYVNKYIDHHANEIVF